MKKNTIFKYCTSLAMGLVLCSELSASWTDQIIAGQIGESGYSGDGGQATSAKLANPHTATRDSTGNLYIVDASNNVIRKVNSSGVISTLISGLNNPQGICLDSTGNLYVADQNNWRVGFYNVATNSYNPSFITGIYAQTLCCDRNNFLYVGANFPSRVDKYNADGTINTANLITATVNPKGICADSFSNIYIADLSGGSSGAGAIEKYSASSGTCNATFLTSLSYPSGICIDNLGNLYITTSGGYVSRLLAGASSVTTIFSGLSDPEGICADASGNLYVAESGNDIIRKLLPSSIALEVSSGSATMSAPFTAAIVHKTGTGTAVLSGNNSSLSTLSIDAGLVQVAASNNMGSALAFAGGNLEVTSGTIAVPTAAVNAAATITTDASAAVSSIAAPYGTSLLTIAGSGVVTAGDMSASATPLSIPGVMYVGASSSSKMPTGVATVPNGGLLKLMGATASSVPGDTEVQSGAVLEVANSVTVPAHTGADVFGTLKFDSGASLKLGASSTWARNISVGTAL